MANFSKEQAKLMAELLKLDGAVAHGEHDPFSSGMDSPSPSFNYIFDNTWCLPDGYVLLLGGQPKGGKTMLTNAMVGHLHKADPDAVVMKFNTEFREKAQMTASQFRVWGIDPARYIVYETNLPEHVFDRIEQQVPRLIQAGIKLRAVIIDSVNDILGRRAINADTVNQMQIGDSALTLQDGFRRIKGILRLNNVSLILTCQVRAEMDIIEQQRGKKTKLAVPFAVKHLAEFFCNIERLQTKAGRTDLSGNDMKDETVSVDMTGQGKAEGDEFGHKIRATMVDSSLGRPGRQAVFTMSHDLGIIKQYEEVFLLGVGFKVLNVGGGGNYSFNHHGALDERLRPYLDRTWRGKELMLQTIAEDKTMFDGIIATCKRIDIDRKNGVRYSEDGKRLTTPTDPLAATAATFDVEPQ